MLEKFFFAILISLAAYYFHEELCSLWENYSHLEKLTITFEDLFYRLMPPVDDPVFRDLGNSTVLLVNQIANLSIKESTGITNLRVPANFLANIITRSPSSLINLSSPEISQYLKHIGNLLFILGIYTEKMQIVGKFLFKEIENEFTIIYQTLDNNDLLLPDSAKKSLTFSRMSKILNLVTDFRDRAKDVLNALNEFEELYRPRIESHAAGEESDEKGGFSRVEDYFKRNREELDKVFEISVIQLKFEELRTGIRGVLISKPQSKSIMKFLDKIRKDLIRIKESFGKMKRRKIVTERDLEVLAQTIEIIQNITYNWMYEGDIKRIA